MLYFNPVKTPGALCEDLNDFSQPASKGEYQKT